MFCYQCEETAKGTGCTVIGVCGKKDEISNLQDLLVYMTKGIAIRSEKTSVSNKEINEYIVDALFTTITNVNFDKEDIVEKIKRGIELRDSIKLESVEGLHDSATWKADSIEEFESKAKEVGILSTENEDIRSLMYLLIYGMKGIAAYLHHAMVLGYDDENIHAFIRKGLIATTKKDINGDELTSLVLEAGRYAVDTMALLDKANTETYGNPEITEVNIGVGNNPAILISGHDLKDIEMLLKQTEDSGIDIYTHGEMLPANYYPAFKKYSHFV